MSAAKIEIKVGPVCFIGEGSEDWLSNQLDKVIEKLPELVNADGDTGSENAGAASANSANARQHQHKQTGNGDTLAAFLKAKGATDNQTRKFLATTAWLETEGKDRVATADVTKALGTHKQGKLGNPAQCLVQNVKAGFVVKDGNGKSFYVSPAGHEELS